MDENLRLKAKITEMNENFQMERLKLTKLNNELSKRKGKKDENTLTLPTIKNKNKDKQKEDFEAEKAKLRNDYRDLEEKCLKLKEKLKEKDEKVILNFLIRIKF